MNSFKGNISFFKGWLNFSSLKVLELLPHQRLEKPLNFDPFGHARFAHLFVLYD